MMKIIKKTNFKKIAFFVLLSIFTLELFNIAFESSWDNYFNISSVNNSTNYFTYFFQTLIYGVHYFSGGWILLYLLTLMTLLIKPKIVSELSNKKLALLLVFLGMYLVIHAAVFTSEDQSIMIGDGLRNILLRSIGFAGVVALVLIFNCSIIYFFLVKTNIVNYKLPIPWDKFSFLKKKEAVFSITPSPVLRSNEVPPVREHYGLTKTSIKTNENKIEVIPLTQVNDLEVEEEVEDEFEDEDEATEEIASETLDSQSEEESKRLLQEYISGTNSNNEATSPDSQYFQAIKKLLEEKLAEFKIIGTIINVMKGPVVDTFELELGAGVKVSRVASASEDLSLALSGAPIRIVFPLKGKTTVGIEVPRSPREIIYLTELLKSDEFLHNKHRIPLVIGKNAFGEPVVEDLAAMPHMLVAGATGAGKSVFINSVLVSLLVRLDHKKLKLILIDPKQLELALYSKLRHLLLPVMTTPSLASCALLWACEEMERRYSLMSQMGVRNIDGYNAKLPSSKSSEFLPYIVIVIDEFADLILSKHGKDIETNICRLAAKARASGIHLILATQRPSVDVITGLIKSNFPTRVSFRVTSSIDSRTILNAMGAESLLGMGDMLYKTGVETFRVHSPFVQEDEIDKITSYLSTDNPGFDSEVLQFIEEKEEEISGDRSGQSGDFEMSSTDEQDPLLNQAIEVVMQYKAASASMLQRRLKIGYNRAANLVEIMEKKGIVGPQQGAKPRRVIIQDLPQE